MIVRAKMKTMEITKGGDPKKPYVRIKLGAVYSNDPESENRSFANATPSGELSLNIDAGRPAAEAFEVGGEYYVDITPAGVPERTFLKDYYQVPYGHYILESRDKSKQQPADYTDKGWIVDGKQMYDFDKLKAETGLEFWRHPKEGE